MTAIPTKAQFQKATDLTMVTSGKRVNDTVIKRIDELIDMFQQLEAGPGSTIILGRLFYATDLWLKLADKGGSPEINTRRKPAVLTFYKTVVQRLVEETGKQPNELPNWLIATFGRAMQHHGAKVDLEDGSAFYMSSAERAKYELVFRNGIAFQRNWWGNGNEMVLANTEVRNPQAQQVIAQFFGGYVVSQGGDFYSGPHSSGSTNRGNGRYHSSYLAGDSVMCGGEIRIKDGQVLEINNNSGHYQPGAQNLAMAVETLATRGVNMDLLMVDPFGAPKSNGRRFLARFDRFAGQGIFAFKPASANTDLARQAVKTTLNANKTAINNVPLLEMLKAHWIPNKAPVGGPGHGVAKKTKCAFCNANENLWSAMQAAMIEARGIEKVQVTKMSVAIVDPARGTLPPGEFRRPPAPVAAG